MHGLIDRTEGALAQTIEAAKRIGKWRGKHGLRQKLVYLLTYANKQGGSFNRKIPGTGTRLILGKDFVPHSFRFEVEFFRNNLKCKESMYGGLIYHGAELNPENVATLAVTLQEIDGWSIHT